jgi:hypothetical protein
VLLPSSTARTSSSARFPSSSLANLRPPLRALAAEARAEAATRLAAVLQDVAEVAVGDVVAVPAVEAEA